MDYRAPRESNPSLWSTLWRGTVLGVPATVSFVTAVIVLNLLDQALSPGPVKLGETLELFWGGFVFSLIPGLLGGALAAIALRVLISLAKAPLVSRTTAILGCIAGGCVGAVWGAIFHWLFSGWHPETEPAGFITILGGYLFAVGIPSVIGAAHGWILAYWLQSSRAVYIP